MGINSLILEICNQVGGVKIFLPVLWHAYAPYFYAFSIQSDSVSGLDVSIFVKFLVLGVRVVPKAIRAWRKLPVDVGVGKTDEKEQLAPRGATNSLWNTFWWNKGSSEFFLRFNIESCCQLMRMKLNSINSEKVCQKLEENLNKAWNGCK